MHLLISTWAWSLISLVGAPYCMMLSDRVPGNCARDFILYTSVMREYVPMNICAYVSPPSIARVSNWIVSVATSSLHHITFRAGLGDLYCLCRIVLKGKHAYCVVSEKVFLIISIGNQAKHGFNAS